MLFTLSNQLTRSLVRRIFEGLPVQERKCIEQVIAAVTDGNLPTAVRPFMFSGKVVHELLLDPRRLASFKKREKAGAIAAAFIIASLHRETHGKFSLSDQNLIDHTGPIMRRAKLWKCDTEVSMFIRGLKLREEERRRKSGLKSIREIQDGIRNVRKRLRREKNLDRKLADVRSCLIAELGAFDSMASDELRECPKGKEMEKLLALRVEVLNLIGKLARSTIRS